MSDQTGFRRQTHRRHVLRRQVLLLASAGHQVRAAADEERSQSVGRLAELGSDDELPHGEMEILIDINRLKELDYHSAEKGERF
jgi:hypothetical protein